MLQLDPYCSPWENILSRLKQSKKELVKLTAWFAAHVVQATAGADAAADEDEYKNDGAHNTSHHG